MNQKNKLLREALEVLRRVDRGDQNDEEVYLLYNRIAKNLNIRLNEDGDEE